MPRGGRREAPAGDRGPRPRGDRGAARRRGAHARRARPGDPQGPGATRQDGREPLLRGLHPHPALVRDRGEAHERRHDDLHRGRVVGEEGRVPARHGQDHRGDGHRRDGRAPLGRRRPAPHRRVDRRRGDQRGRRSARSSHPGAAGRVHPATAPGRHHRGSHRHRRRRPQLPGRPQRHRVLVAPRRRGHADRPTHADARTDRRLARRR